jgi:uncharacterized paraquat-inducible protein A
MEANPTGESTTRPTVAEYSPQQISQIASIYILPAVFLQSVSHKEPAAVTTTTQQTPSTLVFAEALKSWGMVILTLVFVALYGLALIGQLKPLADASMVARIEPIIFVIIGYYFGRLPAQQNEKTLKEEIGRQTQKADAAQHAKEQAQQVRECLEEKLRSVNAALNHSSNASSDGGSENIQGAREQQLRSSIGTALSILRT